MATLIELDRRFLDVAVRTTEDVADLGEYLHYFGDRLLDWPALLQRRLTVVLGEARSGKTSEFQLRAADLARSGCLALTLRMEDVADRGVRRNLDADQTARLDRWSASSASGYLFLDALDEARLNRRTLDQTIAAIEQDLAPSALQHLHILFSARATDWRRETDLPRLTAFGRRMGLTPTQSVSVVLLTPLRDEQVGSLAHLWRVQDVPAFLAAVRAAGAHRFAARPGDVQWLVTYWTQHGCLGRLREMVEESVGEKTREPNRNRAAGFTAAAAREAVEILAGTLALTACTAVRLPDAEFDPERIVNSVDPESVLVGWSRDSISQLLGIAVFEDASYGRVRFHHRSMAEYLAARLLLRLLNAPKRLSRRQLNRMLFPEIEGVPVTPVKLAPVAAWMSLFDEDVRRQAIHTIPEHLLDEGDPASLPVEARRSVLQSYVTRFGGRRVISHRFDRAGLARFAETLPGTVIRELIEAHPVEPDLQRMFLEIAEEGGMSECAEVARAIAVDSGRSDIARSAAIRAVSRLGTAEHLDSLLRHAESLASLDADLAGVLILALYAHPVRLEGIFSLLGRVQRRRLNTLTVLESAIAEVARESSREQLDAFVNHLLDLLRPPQAEEDWLPLSERDFLTAELATSVAAALNRFSEQQPTEPVLNAIDLLERCESHQYSAFHGIHQVHTALSRSPTARRHLFWRQVARQRSRGDSCRHWFSLDHTHLWGRQPEDALWLMVDARSRENVLDRLLAFDVLAIPLRDSVGNDALEALAQADAALSRRHGRILRGGDFSRDQQVRLARQEGFNRRSRAVALRQRNIDARSVENLRQVIDRIRSGENQGALWHIIFSGHGLHGLEVDWEAQQSRFGGELIEAARTGLQQLWQSVDIPLPNGRLQNLVLMCSIGLELSWAAGLSPATTSATQAAQAARVGLHALNTLPEWFEPLWRAQPRAVEEILSEALGDPTGTRQVVRLVGTADVELRLICAPQICSRLEADGMGSLELTKDALDFIVNLPGFDWARADVTARTACEQHGLGTEEFVVWWTRWLAMSPVQAMGFLDDHLHDNDDAATRCSLLHLFGELGERADHYPNSFAALRACPGVLERLIALLFQVAPPSADLEHEEVFSPDDRDHAASLRRDLAVWLANIEGPEPQRALSRLAELPELSDYRDWILRLRDEHASRRASRFELPLPAVRDLILRALQPITNEDELFDVVCDRLDDIKAFIEDGDFSFGELFLPVERPAQLWLAHELRMRSGQQYDTSREDEVVAEKRPDIRVRHTGVSGPVSIELKVAENWSYSELEYALTGQLVGQYLRDAHSRHGVLVLLSIGTPRRWRPPSHDAISFDEVVARLDDLAQQTVRSSGGRIARLAVVGMRLEGSRDREPAPPPAVSCPG